MDIQANPFGSSGESPSEDEGYVADKFEREEIKAMAKVCLRTNLIIDREMIKRGSLIEEDRLPENLKTEKYINKADLSGRDGLVMLLHGFGYTSEQVVNGTIMGYPVFSNARRVASVVGCPSSTEGIVAEGVDYIAEWAAKQRGKLQHEETERRQEALQPEPMKTYDLDKVEGWKAR